MESSYIGQHFRNRFWFCNDNIRQEYEKYGMHAFSLFLVQVHMGGIQRKNAYEHAKYALIKTTLLMRKVSSGPFSPNHTFC